MEVSGLNLLSPRLPQSPKNYWSKKKYILLRSTIYQPHRQNSWARYCSSASLLSSKIFCRGPNIRMQCGPWAKTKQFITMVIIFIKKEKVTDILYIIKFLLTAQMKIASYAVSMLSSSVLEKQHFSTISPMATFM